MSLNLLAPVTYRDDPFPTTSLAWLPRIKTKHKIEAIIESYGGENIRMKYSWMGVRACRF
jgi:hypothetical protein